MFIKSWGFHPFLFFAPQFKRFDRAENTAFCAQISANNYRIE